MASSQRLDDIETSLTPHQAALLWLKEAHVHANIDEYVKWLSINSCARAPHRFIELAIAALNKTDNEGKPQNIKEIGTQAKQEYDFLHNLFLNANFGYVNTTRERALWIQLLLEKLATLKGGLSEIDLDDIASWKKLFLGFYGEIYVESRAFKTVNQKYFPGYEMLFSEVRAEMDAHDRITKFQLATYNDLCQRRELSPLDLGAFESRLRPHIDLKVRKMIDLAKAEVFVEWGRRSEGAELIKKSLFNYDRNNC